MAEAMPEDIRIVTDRRVMDARGLTDLYMEAGWMDVRDEAMSQAILDRSYAVCAALCRGGMVGFVRALSDGVSSAYVLDFYVRRDARKRGIGAAMLNALLAQLKAACIDEVDTIASKASRGIFVRGGFALSEAFAPLELVRH